MANMNKILQYDFQAGEDDSKKAIIAIHGWKGNRNSMRPVIQSMDIKDMDWFFLEAPHPIKDADGCFTWFYENSDNILDEGDLKNLLQDFFNGLFIHYSSKDIYVIGFSQGGLVCLDFVLFLDQPLGGVFPIAGLSRNQKVKVQRYHPCQKRTPIMIAHGKNDDRVPVKASENIYRQLKNQGANVELLLYEGKHKIGLECLRRIKKIIKK